MKVKELIALLQSCNENAEVEVRGTTDHGYQQITEIVVDDVDNELVVIDI